MKERLIDIRAGGHAQPSFPAPAGGGASETDEEAFKKKVLEAAASAKEELVDWNAHVRIGQSGPLDPYPDPVAVLEETKARLDQLVRARAYLPWEQGMVAGSRGSQLLRSQRHRLWLERASVLWRWTSYLKGKTH